MTSPATPDPLRDSRELPRPIPIPPPGPPSVPLDSSPVPPAPPPAAVPPRGHVHAGYEILDPIGAGGFSVVLLARHLESGRLAALKMPRVPAFIGHLRREALMAARFSDPQVVPILDVRLDADPPFLAMPFVEGANLELPQQAPEPEAILAALLRFRGIAEVVARLHAVHIAHGDLKPGNIRLAPDGTVHLLDLGIAREQVAARQLSTLRASVRSVTGEKIAGTLDFMAPEVMSGGKPDAAADVYALGVILHHLLCGRPPAFGVSPEALNPFLPPRSTDFLRSLLQRDPALRPPDAGALLAPLDHFIRAERRCLRRRNGHARRRVFVARMRTLQRGARVLLVAAALLLAGFLAVHIALAGSAAPPAPPVPSYARAESPGEDLRLAGGIVLFVATFSFAFTCLLLAMTTINAWILGVPEKLYKNRKGHPIWSFMMQ